MKAYIIMGLMVKIDKHISQYETEHPEFKTKKDASGKTIKGCYDFIIGMMGDASRFGQDQNGVRDSCIELDDDLVYNMSVEYFMDDDLNCEPKKVEPMPMPTKPTTKKESKPKPFKTPEPKIAPSQTTTKLSASIPASQPTGKPFEQLSLF